MKFNGAFKPHRAYSTIWNDSFGGHTVQITNSNNKANTENNQTVNQKSIEFEITNHYPKFKTDVTPIDAKSVVIDGSTNPIGSCSSRGSSSRSICNRGRPNRTPCSNKGSNISSMIRSKLFGAVAATAKMMRIQQSSSKSSKSSITTLISSSSSFSRLFSLSAHSRQNCFVSSSNSFRFIILLIFFTLINCTVCDDGDDGGASMGPPEFTTVISENTTRGNKKFGDRCEETWECGFAGSICDSRKKSCQCTEDLPVTNHLDKCGKEAAINESCFFNEQCEAFHFQTECRDNRCVCRFEMSPVINKDGNVECKGKQMKHDVERYIDPAMIGILVAMALMFIIICVVLRLFSRARWHENRTIFNTPNPRLMNVSLLRENKLLHGQERRGSRMSVRAPSRQPSMASLRPHSPNPSLGKTGSRSGSRASSNASAVSGRSAALINSVMNSVDGSKPKSNSVEPASHNQAPIVTNITENPAAENVTVEILEPKAK